MALVLAGLIALEASTASSQTNQRSFEVQDQVDLIEVDRRLIAVGSGGNLFETKLELEERVQRIHSQGLLAVAATSSRILGTTARSSTFKTLRLRIEERRAPPSDFWLEDSVAVVLLQHRVVALASTSASWASVELGTHETVERVDTDKNLAVVLTDWRALGFAPESGGFVSINITPKEIVERISVEDSSVTLVTDRRVLVFQAGAPGWSDIIRVGKR